MAAATTTTTAATTTTSIILRRRYTADELEGYSKRCVVISYMVVLLFVVIPLMVVGLYDWGLVIMSLGILVRVMVRVIFKCKKSVDENPDPYRMHQPDQTPIYSVSSSMPNAPFPARPPPLHIPSMFPPPSPGQLTPPTPTTYDPLSRSSVNLSSQLSRAYYSHASSFSSPIIASQSLNRRNSNSSTWPSSLDSPSPPTPPVHNSPSNFAGYLEMEAAIRHAANLQPPAYPEVVQDNPGLPPPLYTTPASDEASTKVFDPSSDGLPSYEAAMSTWQPPADEEHPSRRDDGQRTND